MGAAYFSYRSRPGYRFFISLYRFDFAPSMTLAAVIGHGSVSTAVSDVRAS
jgi:hypothetical protein